MYFFWSRVIYGEMDYVFATWVPLYPWSRGRRSTYWKECMTKNTSESINNLLAHMRANVRSFVLRQVQVSMRCNPTALPEDLVRGLIRRQELCHTLPKYSSFFFTFFLPVLYERHFRTSFFSNKPLSRQGEIIPLSRISTNYWAKPWSCSLYMWMRSIYHRAFFAN